MLFFHFCPFLIVAAFQQLLPHISLCIFLPNWQQIYQYENIKFLPCASCVSSLSANFTKFWKEATAPHSLMSVLSELWCHTVWWVGTNVLEESVTSRVRVHTEGCLLWKCRQHVSLHDVAYWRSIRLILNAERSSYHKCLRT